METHRGPLMSLSVLKTLIPGQRVLEEEKSLGLFQLLCEVFRAERHAHIDTDRQTQ